MATYVFEGQDYEFPDGIDDKQAMDLIQKDRKAASEAEVAPTFKQDLPSYAYPSEVKEDVDPDALQYDDDWLHASNVVYRREYNKDFDGSPTELATYGLDKMGYLDNMAVLAVDASSLMSASTEEKRAFAFLMEQYDERQYSWGGAGRMAKAIATDPTNYVGLATFGVGTVAGQSAKMMSKVALKQAVKAAIVPAIEGAAMMAASNYAKQAISVEGERRDEISGAEVAGSALVGLGAGAVLGGGAEWLATGLRKGVAGAADEAAEALPEPNVNAMGEAPDALADAPVSTKAAPIAANGNQPGLPVPAERPAAQPRFELANDNAMRGAANQNVAGAVQPEEIPLVAANGNDPVMRAANGNRPIPRAANGTTEFVPERIGGKRTTTFNDQVKAVEAANGNAAWGRGGSGPRNPDMPDDPFLAAIRQATEKPELQNYPKSAADGKPLTDATAEAVSRIADMTDDALARSLERIRNAEATGNETYLIKAGIARFNEQVLRTVNRLGKERDLLEKGTPEWAAKNDELTKYRAVSDSVRSLDQNESSMTGHILNDRKGNIETGKFRDISVDSILKEKYGIEKADATPKQLEKAEALYQKELAAKIDLMDSHDDYVRMTTDIQKMHEIGELGKAMELSKQREILKKEIIAADPEAKAAFDKSTSGLDYANEWVISNVFTFKTIVVNMLPAVGLAIGKPALDLIVKGANRRAFTEFTALYSSMGQNMGVAMRAAALAWKVERGLINGVNTDINKVLEHTPAFEGAFGRYLRFFPRVLGATDEFFTQLNYRAYVQSVAAGQAFEQGQLKGLKGKELGEFIDKSVARANDESFSKDINAPAVIDFLREVGMRQYKLKGDKLDLFIKKELKTNPDLYREATMQSGKDFANDMAFKREFTGGGKDNAGFAANAASGLAKQYENFVNKNPWMRLAGQLFFRTPVRVFEEGFRLTPGLNLVTPNFLRDLKGMGPGGPGGYSQVRAQGEALFSYSIGMAVMAAYSTGNITGGGPTDWRQRRDLEASSKWKPYTVKFGDYEFSYRNYDPISTPMKILTNAMDRYADIQVRRAQGEDMDSNEKKTMALISMATLAVGQAVKDASLTEGLSELTDLATMAMDPDKQQEQIIRFINSKIQLLLPNQVQKTRQALEDGGIGDPATMWQALENRVNPSSSNVARRYSALGIELKGGDPMAGLTGLDFSPRDGRPKNVTEKQQLILDTLAGITQMTGTSFSPPTAAAKFAAGGPFQGQNEDLRAVMTSDGKQTWFDRLNEMVAKSDMDQVLYKQIQTYKGSLPVGTKDNHDGPGFLGSQLMATIADYRQRAYFQLAKDEVRIRQQDELFKKSKLQSLGGGKETTFSPYIK